MLVASQPSTCSLVRSSSSSFQGEESFVSSSYSLSIRPPWPPPKVFCNFFQMTVNQSHAFRNAMASSILPPPDYPPPSPQDFKIAFTPIQCRIKCTIQSTSPICLHIFVICLHHQPAVTNTLQQQQQMLLNFLG